MDVFANAVTVKSGLNNYTLITLNAKMCFKIIIFLFIFLASLVASGRWLFLNVGDWLSASDELQKADVIVCLSHDTSRVQKAVDLFRQGYGKKIIATTGLTFESLIKNDMTGSNGGTKIEFSSPIVDRFFTPSTPCTVQ